MKRILIAVFAALLIIQCKEPNEKVDISSLYLPDLNLLYPDFENVDSTKAYAKLANKLYSENRDLQASQMYVEAAWFYNKAGLTDSVILMLNQAIDRGMSNPKILQKFSIQEESPDDPEWKGLVMRLDSIAKELQDVSHFSIEMESMNRFWEYFDRAREDTAKAKEIFKEFVFEGPLEIRDFYYARYQNTDNMYGQMINAAPDYYTYLKNHLKPDSLTALNTKITSWMKNFKSHYPQAVFPKVFVVPGILNSGGTATEMGMFVGGDMYGRSETMPTDGLNEWQKGSIMKFSDLPGLTLHELMHFQQSYQDTEHNESVLMQIIGEGVCDFLVEISSGNKLENDNLKYLEVPENRDFILSELRNDLFSTDNSKWLYNGGSIEDRPHDLGYTMGYLISKSYYNNQEDKKNAIYELLNTDDVVSILKESDYAFLLDPALADKISTNTDL